MSQLDKPSVISKLYNNRRTIVDTSNNIKPTIQPILPSSPAKTYKHTETNSISTDVIDGVKHTVYKQFQSITHIYNNRGVVSTTTHNNTFTYVV
jgi:hypothetical protein